MSEVYILYPLWHGFDFIAMVIETESCKVMFELFLLRFVWVFRKNFENGKNPSIDTPNVGVPLQL